MAILSIEHKEKNIKKMKCKIVCPIGKKLNKPLIGSGKISRRTIIKPFRRKKKCQNKKDFFKSREDFFRNQLSSHAPSKPLFFKTPDAKIIFNYWNSIGFPLIQHQPKQTKIASHAVEKINNILQQYSKGEIIESIRIAHYLFNAKWFKYRFYIAKNKINLPDFFSYSTTTYKEATSRCSNMPRSWFKECLKGGEYLERKYFLIVKDKFPLITNSLIPIWEEYNNFEKISDKDRNTIIVFSKKADDFCKKNNLDPSSIINIVNNMLNKFKTYSPKHVGWLSNDIFWKERLPKELVRYGLFKDTRKIKL